jgi:molybdopterin converting factor small subunit
VDLVRGDVGRGLTCHSVFCIFNPTKNEFASLIFKRLAMKIDVEFLGLPMVSELIGKKRLEVDFQGETVKDIIDELIKRYGKNVRDAFYDAGGNFDMMIQITLNGKSFITADKRNTPLKEGDSLIFMVLLAGG